MLSINFAIVNKTISGMIFPVYAIYLYLTCKVYSTVNIFWDIDTCQFLLYMHVKKEICHNCIWECKLSCSAFQWHMLLNQVLTHWKVGAVGRNSNCSNSVFIYTWEVFSWITAKHDNISLEKGKEVDVMSLLFWLHFHNVDKNPWKQW